MDFIHHSYTKITLDLGLWAPLIIHNAAFEKENKNFSRRGNLNIKLQLCKALKKHALKRMKSHKK